MHINAKIAFDRHSDNKLEVYYEGELLSIGEQMGLFPVIEQAKALSIAHEEILKAIERTNRRISLEIGANPPESSDGDFSGTKANHV